MNQTSHGEHGGATEVTEAVNRLTDAIIGAAIEVYRDLGPGLLESADQRALAHELTLRGMEFEQQKLCPVRYKDLIIDDAYRLDFLVSGLVVVEFKTVDVLDDVHFGAGSDLPQVFRVSHRSSHEFPLDDPHQGPASARSVISASPLCPL